MHREYAVEPAAIGSSWETFLYVFEKFGFQKGRLISRFPKTWPSLVIEAASEAGVGDMARHRIVEKLQQAKRTALIRMGRSYDPTLDSWVDNAIASHAVKPFHGIITSEGRPENVIVSLDELDETHSLMQVPISRNIPRTAADLARACYSLLYSAGEIDLVDPYFHLGMGGNDYRSPLERIMRELHTAGKEKVCFRIHYRAHPDRASQEDILQDPGRWVIVTIPPGYELHMYAWEERQGGEDFHDRYVLCDCGGMQVGAGFAASGAHESATLSLLDHAHAQSLRSRFSSGATVYAQAGQGVRVKSNGDAEFI